MTKSEAISQARRAGAAVIKHAQDNMAVVAYRRAQSIISSSGFPCWSRCVFACIGPDKYHTDGRWEFCEEPK